MNWTRINPEVPVFIDSPPGIQITRLYQDMDDCWDREANALEAPGDHLIRFKHLYAAEKFQDHQHLLHLKGPAVFIAGSGFHKLIFFKNKRKLCLIDKEVFI
jgi:metallo-beta-lactamase family protein